MKHLRPIAEGIGWAIIICWLLGAVGVLDTAIYIGVPGKIIKHDGIGQGGA